MNSSLAEQKEDIHSADSALAIIKNSRLYQYRYKVPEKESRAPERMGFVIGEGYDPPPDCILAEDGRGINLYAMGSVCWRGLQELLAPVDAIQQELEGS